MLDDIILRMKTALSLKSDRQLAHFLEIAPQSVSTWRSRNTTPYALCDQVSQKVGVSIDWLLTGEGSMYRHQANAQADTDHADSDLVYIKEYDLQLAAGVGSYPKDHVLAINSRAFGKRWLVSKGLQADNLSLVRVHGESMEPLLKDKDMVLIDQDRTSPSDAMPFAVRLEDALYVKMVQRHGGVLRLLSLNKLYDPVEVDLSRAGESCSIMGAVVWHAHSWV